MVFKCLSTICQSFRAHGRVIMKELCSGTWPHGYKTFSMLNSVEYEILNAHKYKNIE